MEPLYCGHPWDSLKCSDLGRSLLILRDVLIEEFHCMIHPPSPMQQEGVPSHLLPAVAQAQKEAAAEAAAKDKQKVANKFTKMHSQ